MYVTLQLPHVERNHRILKMCTKLGTSVWIVLHKPYCFINCPLHDFNDVSGKHSGVYLPQGFKVTASYHLGRCPFDVGYQ